MKYVVFKQFDFYWPVVFPDHITHSDVKIPGMTPASAGFVDSRSIRVYGKSESLNLEPAPGDEARLICLFTGKEALLPMLNSL